MVTQTQPKLTTYLTQVTVTVIDHLPIKKGYQLNINIKIWAKRKVVKGNKNIKEVWDIKAIKRQDCRWDDEEIIKGDET